MPTEIKRALRTAAGWAANQTAMEALYGVDGYYTTMTAWDAANGGATGADLVANDEAVVLECYNDWPTGLADSFFNFGFTTDATHSVDLVVPVSERHVGTFDSGFRLITNAFGTTFSTPPYSTLNGLSYISINASGRGLGAGEGSSVYKSLFKAARGNSLHGDSVTGIEVAAENSVFIATHSNYIALDFGNFSYSPHRLQSSICVNTANPLRGLDIHNRGSAQVENCYFSGFLESGSDASASRNNASAVGGTTAPLGTSPLLVDVVASDFIDYANYDYHLSATSQLIGEGADLSADFTDDIDGDVRSIPWDIGFDQYVAAGGAGATLESNATAQSTSTADATTGIPIAGASLSVATSAGVISTSIDMAAAVSAIALSAGVIDTEIRVSVAAIAQALSQAGLDAQTLFEAAAAGQADAGGTLSSDGAALSGAANALADSNATITVAITMRGDALAEALSQAGLTAPGSGLSGSASAQADALAVMLTQINMLGNSSAVVTGSGGIDTILQMVGAAAAASNTLGGLTAQVQFNAQAFAQALAQAGLTTDSGLSSDAQAEADASGWLKIKVGFDGAAVGEAVASGNLSAGAVDIPRIQRWTTKAEKRIWTVKDERSWRVCA